MYVILFCRAVNAQQIDTYQLKSLDGQFGEWIISSDLCITLSKVNCYDLKLTSTCMLNINMQQTAGNVSDCIITLMVFYILVINKTLLLIVLPPNQLYAKIMHEGEMCC